jgi:RNA polymerase sigma-70 factor (ECF subfamily)
VGRPHAGGQRRDGGGAAGHHGGSTGLTDQLEAVFREHWWAAVAVVTRLAGNLEVAEDAVQDACAAALVQWPSAGIPASPRAWLVGTARHKALDHVRREAARPAKEAAAATGSGPTPAGPALAGGGPATAAAALGADRPGGDRPGAGGPGADRAMDDDQLALIFMCCHPALSLAAQTALTLRCVCGLKTAEIAAAFLVPEPTMAQRLVRAKRKITQAGIAMRMPSPADLPARLAAVLRVIFLVFTEGHMATSGQGLVRGELCERALRLARELARLLPGQPEVTGLLALILLTDARRGARVGPAGEPVQLADQDRSRWDRAMIDEGRALVEDALAAGAPGPYQLRAAIAACHGDAATAEDTDWRQIVALYDELLRYEPTPVVAANRAAAVAMADGAAEGLRLLRELATDPALAGWPPLHVAIAELHRRSGDAGPALAAYRAALELGVPDAQRAFIRGRIDELGFGAVD